MGGSLAWILGQIAKNIHYFHCLCLSYYLSFLLPSKYSLSLKESKNPSLKESKNPYSTHGWTNTLSSPSYFYFPPRKVWLCQCHFNFAVTQICLQSPPRSFYPFLITKLMMSQLWWYAVQRQFCLVMDVKLVVIKRGKMIASYHHNADVTPCYLFIF